MDVQRMSESLFILWVVLVSVLIRVLIFSAQFIPIISEDPSVEVVNFCRTPQWYIPRVSFLSFTYIFNWKCYALSGKYPLPYLDTMDICACPLRHALVSKLHHGKSWYSYDWPHHCDRLTCCKADLVFSLFRKNNKRYISLARKVGILLLQNTIWNRWNIGTVCIYQKQSAKRGDEEYDTKLS